jgi:adenylate kinase
MRKYVIMGVQGCGKGTQAKLLAEAFDLVHISVGDIFRWHIQNRTRLAARINRIVNEGRLVPDEIVNDLVHGRLSEHDWNFGFVLDGFPRNENQALSFLKRYDIDAVINIVVPDEVVMQRVLARRLCALCKTDYNLIFTPPETPGRCRCGGELIARADDTEEAVAKRLADFHAQTSPVLELFARKETVVMVDGTAAIDAVQAEIRAKLGLPAAG